MRCLLAFVAKQIDSVLSDIGADAIKTGMLANGEIVRVVARKIRQYRVRKVVVDPVMVAKSGDLLLRKDAQGELIKHLFPLATVVTPNLMEASVLTGLKVDSLEGDEKGGSSDPPDGSKERRGQGGALEGNGHRSPLRRERVL